MIYDDDEDEQGTVYVSQDTNIFGYYLDYSNDDEVVKKSSKIKELKLDQLYKLQYLFFINAPVLKDTLTEETADIQIRWWEKNSAEKHFLVWNSILPRNLLRMVVDNPGVMSISLGHLINSEAMNIFLGLLSPLTRSLSSSNELKSSLGIHRKSRLKLEIVDCNIVSLKSLFSNATTVASDEVILKKNPIRKRETGTILGSPVSNLDTSGSIIESLSLSYNKLASFDDVDDENLRFLFSSQIALDLSHNPLMKFPTQMLHEKSSIKYLNLSACSFLSLPDTIYLLPYLEILLLSENPQLKAIPLTFLRLIHHLTEFIFDGSGFRLSNDGFLITKNSETSNTPADLGRGNPPNSADLGQGNPPNSADSEHLNSRDSSDDLSVPENETISKKTGDPEKPMKPEKPSYADPKLEIHRNRIFPSIQSLFCFKFIDRKVDAPSPNPNSTPSNPNDRTSSFKMNSRSRPSTDQQGPSIEQFGRKLRYRTNTRSQARSPFIFREPPGNSSSSTSSSKSIASLSPKKTHSQETTPKKVNGPNGLPSNKNVPERPDLKCSDHVVDVSYPCSSLYRICHFCLKSTNDFGMYRFPLDIYNVYLVFEMISCFDPPCKVNRDLFFDELINKNLREIIINSQCDTGSENELGFLRELIDQLFPRRSMLPSSTEIKKRRHPVQGTMQVGPLKDPKRQGSNSGRTSMPATPTKKTAQTRLLDRMDRSGGE